jgi:hypothetical protein
VVSNALITLTVHSTNLTLLFLNAFTFLVSLELEVSSAHK